MKRIGPIAQIVLGGTLVIVGGGLLTFVVFGRSSPEQAPGIASHGQRITSVRTLLVADVGPIAASAPGKTLHAVRATGRIPSTATMATVVSDENCAPDAKGVSNCLNRLRMDDGSELSVTHPHRMAEVPCLAPGERISVQRA